MHMRCFLLVMKSTESTKSNEKKSSKIIMYPLFLQTIEKFIQVWIFLTYSLIISLLPTTSSQICKNIDLRDWTWTCRLWVYPLNRYPTSYTLFCISNCTFVWSDVSILVIFKIKESFFIVQHSFKFLCVYLDKLHLVHRNWKLLVVEAKNEKSNVFLERKWKQNKKKHHI